MSYRIKGCGCDCATIPADPCAPCTTGGAYQLQCRSRSGTATLCGYSEFTTPSLPPKKFRNKGFGGSVSARIVGSCAEDDTLRFHQSAFSGASQYNKTTCAITRTSASSGTAASQANFDSIGPGAFADSYIANDGGRFAETLSPRNRRVYYVPALPAAAICGVCEASRFPSCDDAFEVLSDEDTEADAIARVASDWSEWGVGPCCSSRASRAAGVFSFNFVEAEYRIRVAGTPGALVNVELTFTRTNGAPYTSIFQDVAQSPAFPANPDAGWTVFAIAAASGAETCLSSHRLYPGT